VGEGRGGIAFEVLTESVVDQGLVALCAAGGIGFFENVIDQVFVEADGDARLAAGLGFRRKNPSPLGVAEVVLMVHLDSS
jgi:imidazole glycerol phosphate synthase subunit HisF